MDYHKQQRNIKFYIFSKLFSIYKDIQGNYITIGILLLDNVVIFFKWLVIQLHTDIGFSIGSNIQVTDKNSNCIQEIHMQVSQ